MEILATLLNLGTLALKIVVKKPIDKLIDLYELHETQRFILRHDLNADTLMNHFVNFVEDLLEKLVRDYHLTSSGASYYHRRRDQEKHHQQIYCTLYMDKVVMDFKTTFSYYLILSLLSVNIASITTRGIKCH